MVIGTGGPGRSLFPLGPLSGRVISYLSAVVTECGYLRSSILSRGLFSVRDSFIRQGPALMERCGSKSCFSPGSRVGLFAGSGTNGDNETQ